MSTPAKDRVQHAHRVTLIGTLLDVVLGIGKITVGIVGHSYGLVVDGVHSLSDLFSDFVILGVIRYSHHDADVEHPYGHLRFETMATLLLGWLLVAVAGFLIYDNIERIIHGEITQVPAWSTLVMVIISIISKEWIYHYTRRVGEQIRSDMIVANAWHSRSDALSSLVVMVGIIGSMFGAGWLDICAAIVVALIIGRMGWRFAWESTAELVDTGLSTNETNAMRESALQVSGVRDIHFIRGRRMGPHILLELHIEVRSDVSVSEGHHIGACVAHRVMQEHDDIADVTFHIDAEDDGFGDNEYAKAAQLPGRDDVLLALKHCWKAVAPQPDIQKITSHYLGGKINVDVFLPLPINTTAEEQTRYRQQLEKEVSDLPWLASLSIWYG